jgi:hypothetical protein
MMTARGSAGPSGAAPTRGRLSSAAPVTWSLSSRLVSGKGTIMPPSAVLTCSASLALRRGQSAGRAGIISIISRP